MPTLTKVSYCYLAGKVSTIEELNEDLNDAAVTGWEPYMIEQQFTGEHKFCSGWLILFRRERETDIDGDNIDANT